MPDHSAISWPAILRMSGDPELVYVQDQAEWDAHPHLYGGFYLPADVLIDARGEMHSLQQRVDGMVRPQATGKFAPLEEVIDAVRAHAAQTGACCVAKYSAGSIQEAIDTIRDFHRSP